MRGVRLPWRVRSFIVVLLGSWAFANRPLEADLLKPPYSFVRQITVLVTCTLNVYPPRQFRAFFEECEEAGLTITRTGASIIIHWFDEDGAKFNFGTISQQGNVDTDYICWSAETAGDISIGEDYLEGVAEIIGNAVILKDGNPWSWRVKKNGHHPPVSDFLEAKAQWLELITKTIERFRSLKTT